MANQQPQTVSIDGKTLDMTKPETWGKSIQIKPNGFIEQRKNGVTTRIELANQKPVKE